MLLNFVDSIKYNTDSSPEKNIPRYDSKFSDKENSNLFDGQNQIIGQNNLYEIFNLSKSYLEEKDNNYEINDYFTKKSTKLSDKKIKSEKIKEPCNSNDSNNITSLGTKRSRKSSSNDLSDISHQENKTNKNIFEINKVPKKGKYTYRLDDYKKKFIRNFLYYLLNKLRKLISDYIEGEMNLLHMPNYKLYAGNPKEKDNREFLGKTIKEVFTDYKGLKKGISRQKENEKLIKEILEGKKKFSSDTKKQDLFNFLDKSIEEGIKMYYLSIEFDSFKNNEEIKYFDKMFFREKNRKFSLLKDDPFNGFIRLVYSPYYSNKEA